MNTHVRSSIYYITLYYIILHYITSHYITLYYITLYYIILHYITSHYITSHYITLYYITLHHIILKLCLCQQILLKPRFYFVYQAIVSSGDRLLELAMRGSDVPLLFLLMDNLTFNSCMRDSMTSSFDCAISTRNMDSTKHIQRCSPSLVFYKQNSNCNFLKNRIKDIYFEVIFQKFSASFLFKIMHS